MSKRELQILKSQIDAVMTAIVANQEQSLELRAKQLEAGEEMNRLLARMGELAERVNVAISEADEESADWWKTSGEE